MVIKEVTKYDNYILSFKGNDVERWIIWNNAPITLKEATLVADLLESQGFVHKLQYNGEQL